MFGTYVSRYSDEYSHTMKIIYRCFYYLHSHEELKENVTDNLGKTPLQYLSIATDVSAIKALNSVEHEEETDVSVSKILADP